MLEKNWVTVLEAADIIGCTAGHVRNLLRYKKLRAEKFGSCWAIDRKSAVEIAKTPAQTGRPRKTRKS